MSDSYFDVLTFGSATVDFFLSIDMVEKNKEKNVKDFFRIPFGDKVKIPDSFIFSGGGAINTAVSFAKQGLKSAPISILGDDILGRFIADDIKKKNIFSELLVHEKNEQSSFSMIMNAPSGERTVLHSRAHGSHFCENIWNNLPETKGLYFGHLYEQSEVILDGIPAWKKSNTKGIIAWNPGKTQFKQGLKNFAKICSCINVLVLNRDEAELFTRKSSIESNKYEAKLHGENIATEIASGSFFDMKKIAKIFLDSGIQSVVITDGANGSQYFDKNSHWHIGTSTIKPVSTLGAGDAFASGFLGSLLRGKSTIDALKFSRKNAESVIQTFGAQEGLLQQ